MWKEYKQDTMISNGYYLIAKKQYLEDDPTVYCKNMLVQYLKKGTKVFASTILADEVLLSNPGAEDRIEIPEDGFYDFNGTVYTKIKNVTHYTNDFLTLPDPLYFRDMNEYKKEYDAKVLGDYYFKK